MTFYELLGVTPTAVPAVVAAAHKALLREHHPDRAGTDTVDRALREERSKALGEAFAVLSDPRARARYDAKLAYAAAHNAPPAPPPPTSPPPTSPPPPSYSTSTSDAPTPRAGPHPKHDNTLSGHQLWHRLWHRPGRPKTQTPDPLRPSGTITWAHRRTGALGGAMWGIIVALTRLATPLHDALTDVNMSFVSLPTFDLTLTSLAITIIIGASAGTRVWPALWSQSKRHSPGADTRWLRRTAGAIVTATVLVDVTVYLIIQIMTLALVLAGWTAAISLIWVLLKRH